MNTSFYVLTDTHYFETSLGCSGEAYEHYMQTEQMCLKENQEICRSVFEEIAKDKETNIVIMPGDLSKNGEYESHISLIKDLQKLKEAGKEIYVLTARHDFNDNPHCYQGAEKPTIKGTKREELPELYAEFGYNQAIAVDEISLSYVAEIAPKLRLLAINSDGTAEKKGYIDERLYSWLKEQIDIAKADGCKIIAMNHYPIIPQAPIFELIGDAKIKEYKKVAAFLADNGVKYIFTGHMHGQSVKPFISYAGNMMYDVQTSALVGYPAKYRKVTFNDGACNIESFRITAFSDEYMKAQFNQMIPNRLKRMLKAEGDDAKFINKFLYKKLNSLNVGTLCRLLWIIPDKSIKKIKIMDFACDLVMQVFAGTLNYNPDTAVYKTVVKIFKRLGFVMKKLNKKLSKPENPVDLPNLILNSLYNTTGIDNNNCILE
jgi:3',5'-cyclic AMP phosphodiesterase CpdA